MIYDRTIRLISSVVHTHLLYYKCGYFVHIIYDYVNVSCHCLTHIGMIFVDSRRLCF